MNNIDWAPLYDNFKYEGPADVTWSIEGDLSTYTASNN